MKELPWKPFFRGRGCVEPDPPVGYCWREITLSGGGLRTVKSTNPSGKQRIGSIGASGATFTET